MTRVLIVDDNTASAESIAALLEIEHHQVRQGFSAKEALSVARSFKPQIALLDIALPHMDGYTLAAALRKIEGMDQTVMVAVSGLGTANDIAKSKAAGFRHHLVKPADVQTLLALVREAGSVSAVKPA